MGIDIKSMNRTKILGTGVNGLVGSRVIEVLQEKYEFENISRSTGVDISDREQVMLAVSSSDASMVLHLTAKTDVDGCEKDRSDGESGEAWKINVNATHHLVEACKEAGKKLIYVSTDFVFDGVNPPPGGYSEEDTPHPINWYAITKQKGEEIVLHSGLPYMIIRPAFPYGRPFIKKKDFVQAILGRLQSGQSITAVKDQIFMPTFIDDIAYALDTLIQANVTGIYHVVGSIALSPYEAALKIAEVFNCNTNLVQPTSRDIFFQGRANRPYNLTLKHDKIEQLGVKMRTFEEGLQEVKRQSNL